MGVICRRMPRCQDHACGGGENSSSRRCEKCFRHSSLCDKWTVIISFTTWNGDSWTATVWRRSAPPEGGVRQRTSRNTQATAVLRCRDEKVRIRARWAPHAAQTPRFTCNIPGTTEDAKVQSLLRADMNAGAADAAAAAVTAAFAAYSRS